MCKINFFECMAIIFLNINDSISAEVKHETMNCVKTKNKLNSFFSFKIQKKTFYIDHDKKTLNKKINTSYEMKHYIESLLRDKFIYQICDIPYILSFSENHVKCVDKSTIEIFQRSFSNTHIIYLFKHMKIYDSKKYLSASDWVLRLKRYLRPDFFIPNHYIDKPIFIKFPKYEILESRLYVIISELNKLNKFEIFFLNKLIVTSDERKILINQNSLEKKYGITIPDFMIDPITLNIMENPVCIHKDEESFCDFSTLMKLFKEKTPKSFFTRNVLDKDTLFGACEISRKKSELRKMEIEYYIESQEPAITFYLRKMQSYRQNFKFIYQIKSIYINQLLKYKKKYKSPYMLEKEFNMHENKIFL